MYSVGIVGLGQIAYGYDSGKKHEDAALTHFTAILLNPNFSIVFGVEPDLIKRTNFSNSTKVNCFSDLDDPLLNSSISNVDVLVISTPANLRLEIIEKALRFNPKVILLEKPVATNLIESSKIVNLIRNTGIEVFVNYQRNYIPEFIKIKELISEEIEDSRISVVGWYQGDFITNGSHLIALLRLLLIHNQNSSDGYFQLLTDNKKANFTFIRVDHLDAFKFSLELTTSSFNIRYDSHLQRIQISKAVKSAYYPNEFILGEPFEELSTNEQQSLKNVYNQIENFLLGKPFFSVGLLDGVNTLADAENFINLNSRFSNSEI